MTVLLVLIFIGICLTIEAHRQRKSKKHQANVSDVMFHRDIGMTMADGGKKIDTKEEKS